MRKAREKEGVEGEEERREKAGLGEYRQTALSRADHTSLNTVLMFNATYSTVSMYGIAASFLVVNIHTLYGFRSLYLSQLQLEGKQRSTAEILTLSRGQAKYTLELNL